MKKPNTAISVRRNTQRNNVILNDDHHDDVRGIGQIMSETNE
jgi:hypothetical protein